MAVVISFRDIPDDIGPKYLPYEPTLRQKQRGVAFSSASYLHSVTFHSCCDNIVSICGRIYRSQRKTGAPHVINLSLDRIHKSFTDAHCSCKCGASGKCSHVLALVLILEGWKISGYQAIPSQPSSTSLPQQWDKPRGPKIESEAVSQIIIARPRNLNRKRRPVMATFNDNRKIQIQASDMSLLHSMKRFPISYLTDTCTSTSQTVDTPIGPQVVGSTLGHQAPLIRPIVVPKMEDRCGDVTFPKDDNLPELDSIATLKHQWKDLELSVDESHNLEKNTRSQSKSDLAMVQSERG
ncbi:uncharacterized protein LOC124267828 [Haliotis rubra]|uniref:uncharacterized protein LOC124267828 n=1 Tax=Haliotis rubra TaxID=36100 RepID=UPI001EE62472|nr:uncharacterized protein LOC124267828 [Haliotis rubra]